MEGERGGMDGRVMESGIEKSCYGNGGRLLLGIELKF